MRRSLLFALVLVLVIAAPVLAAKHYNGRIGVRTLAGEAVAVSPDPAAFGSVATIDYASANAAPWARVHCYGNDTTIGQNPGLLLDSYRDVFRGNVTVTLGPTPSWSGGGATCYATLLGFEDGYFTPLAETTFAVAP